MPYRVSKAVITRMQLRVHTLYTQLQLAGEPVLIEEIAARFNCSAATVYRWISANPSVFGSVMGTIYLQDSAEDPYPDAASVAGAMKVTLDMRTKPEVAKESTQPTITKSQGLDEINDKLDTLIDLVVNGSDTNDSTKASTLPEIETITRALAYHREKGLPKDAIDIVNEVTTLEINSHYFLKMKGYFEVAAILIDRGWAIHLAEKEKNND